MTTTELLAVFRSEVYDTVAPYLWVDALVYTYINDAQKQFCRETWGIDDSRSFKVKAKTGIGWYSIDPLITRILAATDSETGDDVPVRNMYQLVSADIRFDGRTGTPDVLITGLDKGYLRAYPTPSADKTYNLRTLRLSNDVVAGDEFEIDAQHHLNLLDWVKYRAYSVQDADAKDEGKAQRFRDSFMTYCLKSKTEQGRMRRRVAVVSYGGI